MISIGTCHTSVSFKKNNTENTKNKENAAIITVKSDAVFQASGYSFPVVTYFARIFSAPPLPVTIPTFCGVEGISLLKKILFCRIAPTKAP